MKIRPLGLVKKALAINGAVNSVSATALSSAGERRREEEPADGAGC
ncbi:hypothetical protein [Musicola paradisiaca]|uniref:Uncharacterized protein n=1 Tax=Musicola paradisiaca (strain Ech703) TaxID=579405 RepID=C6C720_MUSP7|nr:hypothetical protein [Musicola paradisiaca]ACS85914.1 hypothetical protein Dd703_2127 [Musicola paradisiaca Ech703]